MFTSGVGGAEVAADVLIMMADTMPEVVSMVMRQGK